MRRNDTGKKNLFSRWLSGLLSAALAICTVPVTAMSVDVPEPVADSIADELQLQTITAKPDGDTEAAVTLDGKMPLDAAVSVQSCTPTAVGSLCAYDITITNGSGEEYQPEADAPIQVEIRNPAILSAASNDKHLRVWHIDDSGIRQEIEDYQLDGERIVFETDGFSVFEVDDGEPPLRTYLFEMPEDPSDNSGYRHYYFPTSSADSTGKHKMICQQIVKDGEKPVFPQLPADISSRYTFTGWYVWDGETLADTSFDFDNVEAVTQNETVTLRAVFKSCVYAIFHDQYRSQSEKFPVYATRRGDLENVSGVDVYDVYGNESDALAEVEISDLSVTYDDESGPTNSLTMMAFKGWTVVPDSCQTQAQILAYTESPNVPVIDTDTILISETTRLYPVFEPICWLEFNTNQDGPGDNANYYSGATYKPPLYFPANEGFDISEQSVPVLAGYTFDGWFTGDDEPERVTNVSWVQDADEEEPHAVQSLVSRLNTAELKEEGGLLHFKEQIVQVDLYAHWIPGTSNYTIVIWKQRPTDDPALTGDDRHWDFERSEILPGTSGEEVTVPDSYTNIDFTGFTFDHADGMKTVQGNGKTILNVYYRRNKHTFTFYSDERLRNLIHTVTALYGSDISDIWTFNGSNGVSYPTTEQGKTTSWMPHESSQYTARITQMLLMPDENIKFSHYLSNNTERTFHYYVEALPGTTNTHDYNGRSFIPYNDSLATVKNDFNKVYYNDDFFELAGFERLAIVSGNGDDVTSYIQSATEGASWRQDWEQNWKNELFFYYTRNSYKVEFIDSFGETFGEDHIAPDQMVSYEEALAGYIPADPTPPVGYEFTGWYADQACSTPIAFTEEQAESYRQSDSDVNCQEYFTMPAHNLRIYAGWETQWFKIEVDPNGGALTGSQATWFWEPYNGDPIEEYKTVTRNFEPDRFGDYHYTLRDRSFYGLGEEWDPREDTDFKNVIVNGYCTRGAFYSTNSSLATSDMRFKEVEGAYRYLGWYEVDPVTGKETPFNFGTRVMKNTYLRLHWKQLDTYLISYQAGEGTINQLDSNEQTFEFLDADNYADHAEVVVTRLAIAPAGKNFVGWQIQNDESGKIYYPGQSFQFDSRFADHISEIDAGGHVRTKRLITLNAVYKEIKNAKIVYDPNGGVVDSRALTHAGGQDSSRDPEIYTSGTSVPLTAEKKISNNQLIVSDLMNNAAVKLADGIGFTNNGYTFCGWSTTPDGQNGSFFRANSIRCYADTEEPLVLYAQWELRLYFDKNNHNAPDNTIGWGGDWTTSGYAWNTTEMLYYKTIRLGSTIRYPGYTPVSSDANEMFRYWSLIRQTAVGSMEEPYDFSVRITQAFADQYTVPYTDSTGTIGRKLTLYGCWDKPVSIPIHIVDTTNAVWEKHDDWLREGVSEIKLGNAVVSLASAANAQVYADPDKTGGRHFAFACTAGNGANDYRNISDDRTITALWYDASDRQVKAKYSTDDAWHPFDTSATSPEAVYLVYYADRTLPVSYMKFKINRTLEAVSPLSNAAPGSIPISDDVCYLGTYVTAPLAWATSGYRPTSYSFAVGERNAARASAIHSVTEASEQDSTRPVLGIRNTWNGWSYTQDGETWQMCGYDRQLYVLYYEVKPCVVTLTEKTIGLPEDMDETFDYTISFLSYKSETVTKTFYYRTGSLNNYTYYEITNNPTYAPDVKTTVTEIPLSNPDTTEIVQNLQLTDGQRESVVLLYSAPALEVTEDYTRTNDRIWIGTSRYYVYYRVVTDTQEAQKMEIVQSEKEDYLTSNDAPGGDQEYEGSCTGGDDPITITYTNRHQLEKHIHLAIAKNGILTHEPELRTTNAAIYSHIFGDTWDLTHIDPATFIIDPDGRYVYAETIAGYEEEDGTITPTDRSLQAESLSFGEIGENEYGYYLNGDNSKLLGTQDIFLVYFERPTIRYVFQNPRTGELEPIDPLKKNGDDFLRDGIPAAQDELLPVTAERRLLLSQISTPGNPAFLLPDLLDHDGKQSMLDLTEIGIPHPDGTMETSRSEMLRLYYANQSLQYEFTETDVPKAFDDDELVVYAIYKIRGYSLTLSKSVAGDSAGGPESYTFRIDSDMLSDGAYYIGGYSTDTVTSAGHSITLTLKPGDEVTIYGLLQGEYTVTEETRGGFSMAATINGHSAAVSGNRVAAYISADTVLRVTNIYPIPVTDAQDTAEPYRMLVSILAVLAAVSALLYSRRKKTDKTTSL